MLLELDENHTARIVAEKHEIENYSKGRFGS
jgi:hypothetical protein